MDLPVAVNPNGFGLSSKLCTCALVLLEKCGSVIWFISQVWVMYSSPLCVCVWTWGGGGL